MKAQARDEFTESDDQGGEQVSIIKQQSLVCP